jgi:hypothetical protein
MSNVVYPRFITSLDLPPDRILEQAIGRMSEVVICGFDTDGKMYFASSVADGADALWHLEKAKKALLAIGDD